jgi:Zn-dependent M16 (insulinase) family peptidase
MDQRWRERVLDVTAADVNQAAQRFLVNGPRQAICVLGEKKDWATAENWDVRKLSMNAQPEEDFEHPPEGAALSA